MRYDLNFWRLFELFGGLKGVKGTAVECEMTVRNLVVSIACGADETLFLRFSKRLSSTPEGLGDLEDYKRMRMSCMDVLMLECLVVSLEPRRSHRYRLGCLLLHHDGSNGVGLSTWTLNQNLGSAVSHYCLEVT